MSLHDDLDWETVTESRPCHCAVGGYPCNGRCNGWSSYGLRRRDPTEAARLKEERRIRQEDDILAQAEAIRQRRRLK